MALDEPVVAVDLLNFNMNWPWPLNNRCHGNHSDEELNNLHAFHLYGNVAKDPSCVVLLSKVETFMYLRCWTRRAQCRVGRGW